MGVSGYKHGQLSSAEEEPHVCAGLGHEEGKPWLLSHLKAARQWGSTTTSHPPDPLSLVGLF